MSNGKEPHLPAVRRERYGSADKEKVQVIYSLLFRVGGYEGISEYGYITRPFTVKDMDRIRAKAKEYPKCLSNNIPECPLEIADDFVLPF